MIKAANKKIKPFLIFVSFLLNFWIIIQIIITIVGPIKENPPKPKTKSIPGRSKAAALDKNEIAKRGMDHKRKLWSFLRNGNVRINAPMGITKNWMPPQEASPKVSIIPEPIIFAMAIFLFFVLIPLRKR